jgi:phosphopantothenoylcysteine synthetase/decarboxylase
MAPAMNNDMWANKGVQRNIAQLRADGVYFVDPEEGWLSCRRRAIGRMAAPDTIIAAIQRVLKVK